MPPSAYDKALQLLASRDHFRRELEGKLARRGFPPEEVEEALERLAAQGYLDDARTALSFVDQRLERGPEGRPRLRAELARRGAPADVAAYAAATMIPEDDREVAHLAAARWARFNPRGDAAALARHLQRKGFSRRAIVAVLETRPGSGEGAEDGLEGFEEDLDGQE